MATIKELVGDKPPGSVKVTRNTFSAKDTFSAKEYFIPYYKDQDGDWCGLDHLNRHASWFESKEWELYEEPKPKVKKWLWVDKSNQIIGTIFYDQLDEKVYRKLEWSETIFEE